MYICQRLKIDSFLRQILILLVFATWTSLSHAQYHWDFGVKLGAANYLGDIGGGAGPGQDFIYDMKLEKTRFNVGGSMRYFINPSLAASVHLTQARLLGEDNASQNPERYSRNLSFRNDIIELSTRLEIHFFKINDVGRTFRYRLDFNIFAWGGAGVFFNNPRAQYQGQWYSLQPLMTEGKKYGRLQFCAPVGLGLHYRFLKRHLFGFQAGWRFTLTDYLDDVSSFYKNPDDFEDPIARALADRSVELSPSDPLNIGSEFFGNGSRSNPAEPSKRGNPQNNDSYLVANFTYSYSIRGKTSFSRRKYSFVRGKPRRRRSKAKF